MVQECVAGRGDHYIEHGGYTWRTLDGADPAGPADGAPNAGCQCTGPLGTGRCNGDTNGDGIRSIAEQQTGDLFNNLPLPAGWVLAPDEPKARAVIADHGWSTNCVVTADDHAWQSRNSPTGASPPAGGIGFDCGSSKLTTSSNDCNLRFTEICDPSTPYGVNDCNLRVLIRCG
eukprot:SAG22_NODE_653_length_8139_cov_13.407711_7_plen_174_part_00